MAAGPPAEKIPRFQEPESAVSPVIKNLLHEKVVVENGISYSEWKGIGPRKFLKVNLGYRVCISIIINCCNTSCKLICSLTQLIQRK